MSTRSARKPSRRTPLPRAVWVGIGLALVGLSFVAQMWHGFTLSPIGLLAGLGSGLSTTGYYLIGEHGAAKHDPFGMLAVGLCVGAVIVWLAAPPWTLPWHVLTDEVTLAGTRWSTWAITLAVVVISTAIPYVLGLVSLRFLPSAAASVLGLLEPVTATLLAWWLIDERLTLWQVFGGVVLLAGAVLVQVATRTYVPPEPEPVDPADAG